MIISKTSFAHLLALPAAVASSHPKLPLLHPKFHSHINCPYADEWLTKGPEQAAINLGLKDDTNHRVLEDAVMGRCTYTNPFSGDSCTEFRGSGWTTDAMAEQCSQESSGSFMGRQGCASDNNTAGYCVKSVADDTYEYNMLVLTDMADCAGNKMACETFVGGSFKATHGCAGEVSDSGAGNPFDFGSFGSNEPSTCGIAPGAIGAAHQNAFSAGTCRNVYFHFY